MQFVKRPAAFPKGSRGVLVFYPTLIRDRLRKFRESR